ncbi:hypothetical protein Ndes2526B_g08297 [Nannochloris sp. 'desiccata']
MASTSYQRSQLFGANSLGHFVAARPHSRVSTRGINLITRAALDGQQSANHGKPDIPYQADSPSDDSEEHIRRRTAWNKGKSMPEAARMKLSEAQKKTVARSPI